MKGSVFGGVLYMPDIIFQTLDARFGPPCLKIRRCWYMAPKSMTFRPALNLRIWDLDWLFVYGKPVDGIQ